MRNTISRQFVKNACTCAVYNNGKVHEEIVFVPYGFNTEASAEKYIRKNADLNGKLAAVIRIEKIASLFGMEESEFISKAKAVDARTKETRGFISKTVKGYAGTLVYMNKADHTIGKMEVVFSENKKLDVLAKKLAPVDTFGITIENVHEVEQLYVMSEVDFIANARPMKDHQHYYNMEE